MQFRLTHSLPLYACIPAGYDCQSPAISGTRTMMQAGAPHVKLAALANQHFSGTETPPVL